MHSWWKWCQIVAWTDFKSFEWCETSNPFRELYQIGPIENFKFLKCSKVANPFREWSEKGALANFKYLKCSKVANPVRECSEKVAVANFKYLKCNKVANPFGEWSENIEPFSNALVNQWRLISNFEGNMEMSSFAEFWMTSSREHCCEKALVCNSSLPNYFLNVTIFSTRSTCS